MNPLGLTDREVQIVWAWSIGRDLEWLADQLGLSVWPIRHSASKLRKRLGVKTKTKAVAIVLRDVLSHEPPRPKKEVTVRTELPPPNSAQLPARLVVAAIAAIRNGADPMLTLSYVIWPTSAVEEALAA